MRSIAKFDVTKTGRAGEQVNAGCFVVQAAHCAPRLRATSASTRVCCMSDVAQTRTAMGPAAMLMRNRDRLAVFVALVAIWQVLSLTLGTYWVGSPWGVLVRLVQGIAGIELLNHASYTLGEAIIGFILGGVPAIILPFALRRMPFFTAVIDPFMVGGYGMPKLALAPLFVLWFGIGIESKIALITFTVFFIVYFATLGGIRALDPKLVQMAQISGASEYHVARRVVFPGAVPHIFAGFRLAMPYAIGGAVVAELISANRGLGYLVQFHSMNFDTTGVFVSLTLVCIIVFIGNWLVNTIEKRLLKWQPAADKLMQAEA